MKKPEFLNKLTIIDILIIICIIGAAGFAIYHMVDDDSSKPSSTSFDYSTNPKILETYLDYYQEGNVITSTIVGTKSDTGEEVEVKSRVLWLGESENEKINIDKSINSINTVDSKLFNNENEYNTYKYFLTKDDEPILEDILYELDLNNK